jgi:hypothetical protein
MDQTVAQLMEDYQRVKAAIDRRARVWFYRLLAALLLTSLADVAVVAALGWFRPTPVWVRLTCGAAVGVFQVAVIATTLTAARRDVRSVR